MPIKLSKDNRLMKKFVALCSLFLISLLAFAGTKRLTVDNGDWSTGSSWLPAGAPADGDEVIIPEGYTVIVKRAVYSTAPNLYITIYGTMKFEPSGKLELGVNSIIQLLTTEAKILSNGTPSELITIAGTIKFNGKTDVSVSGPAYTSADTEDGFDPVTPLRIQLTHFAARDSQDGVVITWHTGLEENADRFEIERSANARQWQLLATRPTKGKNITYTYTDALPLPITGFYRLKMIDIDGSFAYSPVVKVAGNSITSLQLGPNPATSYLAVTFSQPGNQLLRLQVLNTAGQVVKEKVMASTGYIRLDLEGLTRGQYYLVVTDNQRVLESRAFLIK
jgi:hypothetical protein